MKRSIFIEGIPGTGKSTMQTRLAQKMQEYRVYREGDRLGKERENLGGRQWKFP
ncbi:MAG: hypothetical protein HFI46_15095 [Lachnospiraceae bacterium]|jgi:broad-specificity NMP kinase|nr:hypothetical protein [Lachnospiraceae bacterium]